MDTKIELENVPSELFDKVWKLVLGMNEAERHFNNLQHAYRALASTWLLATFAAVGFLLSDKTRTMEYGALLIWGIGIAGSVGIVLLWIIDLLAYHRLLDAYFFEGVALEIKYPWLPQVRTNMLRANRLSGAPISRKMALFYACSSSATVAVSAVSMAIFLHASPLLLGTVSLAQLLIWGIILRTLMRATLKDVYDASSRDRALARAS